MTITSGTTANSFSKSMGQTSNFSTIANNFDQFLSLLTTQLKNQSPLDPLDTNQFTEQLVQFASVEQQLKTNDTLTTLLALTKATTATNAYNYIGSTVTADGDTSQLKAGRAEWSLDAARAGEATITIKDKNGSVVATDSVTLRAGKQAYTWNGQTSTGANAADGEYTIQIQARDTTGSSVSVKTEIKGVVDSVDLSGDLPVLVIGQTRVQIDKVKSISRQDS